MAAKRAPFPPEVRDATAGDRLPAATEAILLASLGEGPALSEVVAGEIAALLDAEVAWVHRLSRAGDGVSVEIAAQVGLAAPEVAPLATWLSSAPPPSLGYDLGSPAERHNAVLSLAPGQGLPPEDGWRTRRLGSLAQLGVLVSEGAEPLAWVGAFRPSFAPDHARALARLLPALRCALALDRRRAEAARSPRPAEREERLARVAKRWKLTARQVEVLRGVLEGKGNKEICVELGCARVTVERHVTTLLRRAGVDRRSALAAAIWTG